MMCDVRRVKTDREIVDIFNKFRNGIIEISWYDERPTVRSKVGKQSCVFVYSNYPGYKSCHFEFYTGKDNIRFDGCFSNETHPEIIKWLDDKVEHGVSKDASDYISKESTKKSSRKNDLKDKELQAFETNSKDIAWGQVFITIAIMIGLYLLFGNK